MNLILYKYHGTGNDFIIIDNWDKGISLTKNQIAWLCHRRFGIGADGLMYFEQEKNFDFKMVYFNSDGKEGSMCGNGGRCISAFAYQKLQKKHLHFIATDGEHFSEIISNNNKDTFVSLKMNDVTKIEKHPSYFILNTGSPHYIKFTKNIKDLDVYNEGKKIRYNELFSKQGGVNVNFVEIISDNTLYVRTYERGVEDETYSCGTGVTASAIAYSTLSGVNDINIKTNGGNLKVIFENHNNSVFKNILLEGETKFVFITEIEL